LAPSFSPSRQACHQPTGSRSSFSRVESARSNACLDQVPAARAARERRLGRRIDDDVGAATRRQRAPPRREVGRDDRPDALRLQGQDHAQAHRPAADDDRDVALAHLAAPHRVPGDGHRLGQRRDVGRQPVGHREHQRLLNDDVLGVRARRVLRQARRVDPVRVADQRQRDDGRPGRDRPLGLGPVLEDPA
jgi:hypothetical protein